MSKKIIATGITLVLWAAVMLAFRQAYQISSPEDLSALLSGAPGAAATVFFLISVTRVLTMLPGVVFMLAGSLIFGPVEGFLLSWAGLVASELLVYGLAKLSGSGLLGSIRKKSPALYSAAKVYRQQFLVLGTLCPVAPTDVVCFLSASFGMSFRRYLLSVALLNAPVVLAYTVLGTAVMQSPLFMAISVLTLVAAGLVAAYHWKRISRNIPAVADAEHQAA